MKGVGAKVISWGTLLIDANDLILMYEGQGISEGKTYMELIPYTICTWNADLSS